MKTVAKVYSPIHSYNEEISKKTNEIVNPVKTKRKTKKRKASTKTRKRATTKKEASSILKPTMTNLRFSLQQDCTRLASYLKQETHRKGFVY